MRRAIAYAATAGAPRANGARIDARELGRDALVGVEAQHPVVRRLRDREVLLRAEALPARARPRARPQRRASATVSSRLPESTTTVSAANGADARQSASSWAASRVITTSDRGSDSDMRGSSATRGGTPRLRDSTWFARATPAIAMSGVLVVRPSSLGDIVHALALVSRRRARTRPARAIDWVAEEAFVAAACALDPRHPPRRSRSRSGAGATRRSRARRGASSRAFRATLRARALRRDPRPAGAGQGRADRAHGARAPPRLRPREHPRAARDAARRRASRDRPRPALHRQARARSPPPRSATRSTARRAGSSRRRRRRRRMPARPYVARVPRDEPRATSCGPKTHWRALVAHFARAGFTVLLPWGSDAERARSERSPPASRNAIVPPRQSLPELAALARAPSSSSASTPASRISPRRSARRRSRSSPRPTPALAGVARRRSACARPRRQRRACPTLDDVDRSARGQRAARARRDADARALHAAVVRSRCRWLPLRLWWRGRREPGYREHDRRALRPLSRAARRAARRRLDPRGVARRDARRGAARRAARRARARRRRSLLTHMTATGREAGARAVRRPRRAGVAALRRAVRGARVPRALRAARGPPDGDRGVAEPRRRVRARRAFRCSSSTRACRSGRCAATRAFASLTRPMFAALAGVAAQTRADAARLRDARRARRRGDRQPQVRRRRRRDGAARAGRASCASASATRDRCWLAASTRDGEEALILDALARTPLAARIR